MAGHLNNSLIDRHMAPMIRIQSQVSQEHTKMDAGHTSRKQARQARKERRSGP